MSFNGNNNNSRKMERGRTSPLICEAQMDWYKKTVDTVTNVSRKFNITMDQALEVEKLRHLNFLTGAINNMNDILIRGV